MFDHSVILVFKHDNEEAVLDALMDADVDVTDIENEDGVLSIFAPHTDYYKARQTVLDAFPEVNFDVDEIQFIPHAFTSIGGDDVEMFEKFLDMLNDLDDVQHVYHNVENA